MKKLLLPLALVLLLLSACGQTTEEKQEATYMQITAEEAKEIMDTQTGYVILDVRTQ